MSGGLSSMPGCQATQEALAPELYCPDRGVAEEPGGAGTQEAVEDKGCVFRLHCDTVCTLKCIVPPPAARQVVMRPFLVSGGLSLSVYLTTRARC